MNPYNLLQERIAQNVKIDENIAMDCGCPFCNRKTFTFIKNLPDTDRTALLRGHREDLYSLPTSAQIFFRKFILNNNFPTIPLNLQKIAQKLNLTDKIRVNLEKTVVTNVLEPLKRQGFIETYDNEPGLHGAKFIIKRDFSKKS
jgi:hypothetical protein